MRRDFCFCVHCDGAGNIPARFIGVTGGCWLLLFIRSSIGVASLFFPACWGCFVGLGLVALVSMILEAAPKAVDADAAAASLLEGADCA